MHAIGLRLAARHLTSPRCADGHPTRGHVAGPSAPRRSPPSSTRSPLTTCCRATRRSAQRARWAASPPLRSKRRAPPTVRAAVGGARGASQRGGAPRSASASRTYSQPTSPRSRPCTRTTRIRCGSTAHAPRQFARAAALMRAVLTACRVHHCASTAWAAGGSDARRVPRRIGLHHRPAGAAPLLAGLLPARQVAVEYGARARQSTARLNPRTRSQRVCDVCALCAPPLFRRGPVRTSS